MEASFGERLKRLRKNAGMTQADVATQLNKSASAVRMWELGANEPDIRTLVRLSIIFDSSLDYLMCRDLFLGEEGAVRTGLPVYRLSEYGTENTPAFYKSIPSDYLSAGGTFFMLLHDSRDLSPFVPENAILLIRRQDACLEGQLCFVRCRDAYLLRKVNFFDGGVLLTGALGETTPLTSASDSADFEILGVATEYSKSLI